MLQLLIKLTKAGVRDEAALNLAEQYTGNNCAGDPNGGFCNFTPIGLTFADTAKSIGVRPN